MKLFFYKFWQYVLSEWRTRNAIETSDNLCDTLRNCVVWSLLLIVGWLLIYFYEDILIWLAHIGSYVHKPVPPRKISWHQLTGSLMCGLGFVGIWICYAIELRKRMKHRHGLALKSEGES